MHKRNTKMIAGKKWCITYKKNPQAILRIFCFPHSGGGASAYFPWVEKLSSLLELVSIQLPGRENRFYERLVNDLDVITTELCKEFEQYKEKSFIVFGHSLGALLCYEFVKSIHKFYNVFPKHMFVSAAKAPHLPFRMKKLSHLSDNELIEEISIYGEIDKTLKENSQILSMFLPVFRSDFSIGENYFYEETPPRSFDITAFYGENDSTVREEEINAWKKHTVGHFKSISFEGGHFFIKDKQDEILKEIEKTSFF